MILTVALRKFYDVKPVLLLFVLFQCHITRRFTNACIYAIRKCNARHFSFNYRKEKNNAQLVFVFRRSHILDIDRFVIVPR